MTVQPILPVIDYTSRDYEAIREDMIRLIRERLPQWTAQDPSDFGVAMVEAYAYAVDQLHYYLDRVANEAYLGTALQRESVLSIAAMFGYKPYGAQSSTVGLEFGNTTSNDIIVPAGAQFQASIQRVDEVVFRTFELDRNVRVPANSALGEGSTGMATEGRTYVNERLGVSTGRPFQRLVMPRLSVLPSTIKITSTLNETVVNYRPTERIEDARPDDPVFTYEQHSDGSTSLQFGDGLSGSIPALHAVIEASYRVGGGVADVGANQIRTLVEPIIPGLLVNNPLAAFGGRDPESLRSVRINASRRLRTPLRRAVTLNDYVLLANNYTGVQKAKAVSNHGAAVSVFASPADDGTGEPVFTDEERQSLRAYLDAVSIAGTTVTVIDPVYVPVYVLLTVYCQPQARQEDVRQAVAEAVANYFDFDNITFDYRLTVYELSAALTNISGLAFAQVDSISTQQSDTDAKDPILFNELALNAMPVYRPDSSLTLTMVGGLT